MEKNEDFKKYFDSKQYITKIIGVEEEKEEEEKLIKTEDKISKIISLLTDSANKSFKEATLLNLKKDKGGDLLLLAIASPKADKNRHLLIAACWESEINFSKYLPFFILLALDADYLVSLEAMTVISTMEGPFENDNVKNAIKKVKEVQKNITSEKAVLLNDLVYTLEGFVEQ
jgi:ABC-type Fe3+-citrate transport system substrate-binding protein